MYRDITGASASGSLLSACIEISVKNLPFQSIIIKDMTLNMEPLADVIDHIIDFFLMAMKRRVIENRHCLQLSTT